MNAGRRAARDRGTAENGLLGKILARLSTAEIAEGVLGDREEARRSRSVGAKAGRVGEAAEDAGLVICFARERIVRSLRSRLGWWSEDEEEAMARMGEGGERAGLRLLGRWILASAVAWAAALAAAVALFLVVQVIAGLDSDRFLAFGALACLGAGVGLAQSIVMGPVLARPRDWFWATLAGHIIAMIALLVPWFRRFSGPEIVGNTAMLVLIGAVIGGTQWWILRRRFRAAGLWVPATALGFLSFLWIIMNPVSSLGQFVLAGAALGAAASILPGAILAWFMTQQGVRAAASGAAAART